MKTNAIKRKLGFEAKLQYVWKGRREGEAVAALWGSDGKYRYSCIIVREREKSKMDVIVDDELGFRWIRQWTFDVNKAGELDVNLTFMQEPDALKERTVEMAWRLAEAGEEFAGLFPPCPEARRML